LHAAAQSVRTFIDFLAAEYAALPASMADRATG
jgi:hypothetical protein